MVELHNIRTGAKVVTVWLEAISMIRSDPDWKVVVH